MNRAPMLFLLSSPAVVEPRGLNANLLRALAGADASVLLRKPAKAQLIDILAKEKATKAEGVAALADLFRGTAHRPFALPIHLQAGAAGTRRWFGADGFVASRLAGSDQ